MRYVQPEGMHFFASSAGTWMTTTPERSLSDLLKAMQAEGLTFNLFLVPVPYDADYEIKRYQPQVEGTQWLGYFTNEEMQ